MNAAKIFNKIWLYTAKADYTSFVAGLNDVKAAQDKLLFKYLNTNSNTYYGKKYSYSKIKNYDDFIKYVPVIDSWHQLREEQTLLESGEANILSRDDVFAFEETAGTTGFSKLIPYTNSLKREFGKALNAWMYSLYTSKPATFNGRSFWSISPALKERRHTASGTPIGLVNDTEYLDKTTALLMNQILAIPSSVHQIDDKRNFYFTSLIHLLKNKSLSFVSVWSPNYFLILDEFLRNHFTELLAHLRLFSFKRSQELEKFQGSDFTWIQIWPDLTLISCWTDAQAAIWIPALKEKTGGIEIQGKGLMSTECVCSIPFGKVSKNVLAYHSHFFEFRNIENNAILRAHELEEDAQYEIIVSTGSGIMRYATGDIVKINGHEQTVPYFSFLGRKGASCDWVGEKIYEHHIYDALLSVFGEDVKQFTGVYCYPQRSGLKVNYTLAIELKKHSYDLEQRIKAVEQIIAQNPYYSQALKSGQLSSLSLQKLDQGFTKRFKAYYQTTKQIKDGDIKMPILIKDQQFIDFIKL